MKRTSRTAAGAALAGLVLVVSACGGDGAKKPSAPARPVPPSAPKVQADRKEQEELSRQVKGFVLTDAIVDGVAASDKDLADFWANPVESRKVLGQLTLTGILDAIDKAPRVKETFQKHGLICSGISPDYRQEDRPEKGRGTSRAGERPDARGDRAPVGRRREDRPPADAGPEGRGAGDGEPSCSLVGGRPPPGPPPHPYLSAGTGDAFDRRDCDRHSFISVATLEFQVTISPSTRVSVKPTFGKAA